MIKVRDYRALEREYVTSQISLRELCRRHGVSAHSLVVVQARQGKWAEKREAHRARESASFITKHADRMAARAAEVRVHALDAIDEAITKFRSDMKRTEKKLVCGDWVEVPVMLIAPKDVALLIDKLQVLFDRPPTISEGRSLARRGALGPHRHAPARRPRLGRRWLRRRGSPTRLDGGLGPGHQHVCARGHRPTARPR